MTMHPKPLTYTYTLNVPAWLDGETVTIPDQIDNLDALIRAVDGQIDVMTLDHAQKYHDRERTVFPARRRYGSYVSVRLDGDAYGLWTGGTGDMIVRAAAE